MQHTIVLIIILVAVFFLARRFLRFLKPGRKISCADSCCGCSSATTCTDSRPRDENTSRSDATGYPGQKS